MTTHYKTNDEYSGLLARVCQRGMPEDWALYGAALDYLMDSTQDLNTLADRYSNIHCVLVYPAQIEELAGEMYARDQVITNKTLKEGDE
jgi:hypothetical protein